MFSQTVVLCSVFSTHDTCFVLAGGLICSNFVSTVDSCNDIVNLLGPMFCIACYDSCLAAVVH